MALVHLNETAAAPPRRRIVAKEAEVLRFFGISGGHGASCLIDASWPGLSRPSTSLVSSLARRGCQAQGFTLGRAGGVTRVPGMTKVGTSHLVNTAQSLPAATRGELFGHP